MLSVVNELQVLEGGGEEACRAGESLKPCSQVFLDQGAPPKMPILALSFFDCGKNKRALLLWQRTRKARSRTEWF